MASSFEGTVPELPQDDDLVASLPEALTAANSSCLGEEREAEHLAIEVDRPLQIGHIHHDTMKVHLLLQVFERKRGAVRNLQ